MSPATFLVSAESLADTQVGSVVILDNAVSHHIKVTRIQPDELVDLVDGQGTRVTGVIRRPGEFLIQKITHENSAKLQVTVVQALIKGDRLERAIEMMTEVGVFGFIPWEADHSVVRWTTEKAERNRQKWENLVRASVEQSRRSYLPVIHSVMNSKNLMTILPDYDHVILMDESASQYQLDSLAGRILLIIGPEGGFSESERLSFASANNAQHLTIGTSVFRGATAGVVGMTYLLTRFGEWGSAHSGSVEG